MMPRSHRFFSAIRYLVSPRRSSQRRQNANVPKFSLMTFSKCLALGSLRRSGEKALMKNDKKNLKAWFRILEHKCFINYTSLIQKQSFQKTFKKRHFWKLLSYSPCLRIYLHEHVRQLNYILPCITTFFLQNMHCCVCLEKTHAQYFSAHKV